VPVARARGRALGGVTRQWLFDNPKVVVLERIGTVARFHPTLLALCAAMRVEPKLCAVRKPRQKGKVERAIRYLRDRFLAGRTITGVEQGNRLLAQFIAEIVRLVRSDADPVHLGGQPMQLGAGTDAAHSDHRLEAPPSDSAHAVVNPEPAGAIRIAGVGPLVDERAHE